MADIALILRKVRSLATVKGRFVTINARLPRDRLMRSGSNSSNALIVRPPRQCDSYGRVALDRIDQQTLPLLQAGTVSKSALVADVHLSSSAFYERMRRLEKETVIQSYHAFVNPRAIGNCKRSSSKLRSRAIMPATFRRFESYVLSFRS